MPHSSPTGPDLSKPFVIEGEAMAQQLRQLINTLPEMEQHRAQRILKITNITGINSPILTKAGSRAPA